mmetsp:Transcript_65002/g.164753  ORF Transcript_65002/g.164753 Transcript_65002/m.164753 type:complete len:740 (+) Transcript_65002:1548-3767(+)
MLAPVDALVDQRELVLSALELALDGQVLLGGRLHLAQALRDLVVLLAHDVHLLLQVRHLLQPHQEVATPRCRAARDRTGRIVQVAVLGDRAHANVRVESHLLGSLSRVTHQKASEDELHGRLDLPVATHDLQSQVQIAARRHDVPGLLHGVLRNRVVHDLVQRDDGDAPAELALLEQGLARLLVVHDDKEETAARADLQGPVVLLEVGLDVEELRDDALHLGPVEAPVRVRVVEIDSTQLCPELVQALLRGVPTRLALPSGGDERLIALRIELLLAQNGLLLGDLSLGRGLLLGQPLAVLFALGQHLLGSGDLLLQAADGHALFLLVRIELPEPRLRLQKLLAHGLALALALALLLRGDAGNHGLHGPLRLLDVLAGDGLLRGEGIPLLLLLLGDLLLGLHVLEELSHDRLARLLALVLGLQVRIAVLQLGLRDYDLFGQLRVLILESFQVLRSLGVALGRTVLQLLLGLLLPKLQSLQVSHQLPEGVLHLIKLLVLVLQAMRHLNVLVGDAEALQTLDLVVVGHPQHVIGPFALELLQGGSDLLGQQAVDLVNLVLLLLQGLESTDLFVLVHARTGRLLDHTQSFLGLHVDHLGDTALHDQEVRVVDIEGDRVEKVLDLVLLHIVRVEQIPVAPSDHDLAGDGDLIVLLVADGAAGLLLIVEYDCHASLGDTCLTLLVDQLRQVANSDLGQVRDTQDEANRVQDVGLAAAVQTGDRIELLVERPNVDPRRVGLESIDD